MTTLSNGSITVRTPTADDAPAVAEAARASFAELDPWMPWMSADYSPDDASSWIETSDASSFVILDLEGSVIGTCGLNAFDLLNRRANLGYWVHTRHTGRGVATAAAALVAAHGLTDLGLLRLEVTMSVHNTASRHVAERLGATLEGTLRNRLLLKGTSHDAHSFSITSLDQLEGPLGAHAIRAS